MDDTTLSLLVSITGILNTGSYEEDCQKVSEILDVLVHYNLDTISYAQSIHPSDIETKLKDHYD